MNPNKALWEKGDFTCIAETMRESGEALVKELEVTNGLDVLDLGCGDGTTALPAARLGANVLGVDIASNLVAAGNERARQLGLSNCRFEEGDASSLEGIDDEQFDLVVTIFGAMFAPRPFDVAKEMVRVTRPGGRVGIVVGAPPGCVGPTVRRDPACQAADNREARISNLVGNLFRAFQSIVRSPPRANDSDRVMVSQLKFAPDVEDSRRIVDLPQQRWVVGVFQS